MYFTYISHLVILIIFVKVSIHHECCTIGAERGGYKEGDASMFSQLQAAVKAWPEGGSDVYVHI